MNKIKHSSDCALHNEPSSPNGECNCYVSVIRKDERDQLISKIDSRVHCLYKYQIGNKIDYWTILEVSKLLGKIK